MIMLVRHQCCIVKGEHGRLAAAIFQSALVKNDVLDVVNG
jgi:hypothetical protein